jgi:hypothetical protein
VLQPTKLEFVINLKTEGAFAGVKIMWQNTRRELASSLIFLRAVRNQSCSMSEGADEINAILVSLSRNISFL